MIDFKSYYSKDGALIKYFKKIYVLTKLQDFNQSIIQYELFQRSNISNNQQGKKEFVIFPKLVRTLCWPKNKHTYFSSFHVSI